MSSMSSIPPGMVRRRKDRRTKSAAQMKVMR